MTDVGMRILAAAGALIARCPRCLSLVSADPSLRLLTTCLKCHAVLLPRRLVDGGVVFAEQGEAS